MKRKAHPIINKAAEQCGDGINFILRDPGSATNATFTLSTFWQVSIFIL